METAVAESFKGKKGFLRNSMLLLLAFSSAFFPRLLTTLKIPSLVNFLHFALVPFAFGIILTKSRTKDPQQIAIASALSLGLFIFLVVEFTSAFLNDAGVINIILSYLLWTEPFMLLAAIIYLPMPVERFEWFKAWMNRFVFFHIFLVYIQKFVLRLERLAGENDNMQGVFYRSGSGHVVGASVAASFAVYYLICAKDQPLWKRIIVAILCFGNILLADAKQVLVTLIVGLILLRLSKVQEFGKLLAYMLGITLFIVGFWWAIYNIESLSAFTAWNRPELYGPDGEAPRLKFTGIYLTLDQFTSPLDWWLGLGPGHTIDRLGGWMLQDYSALLTPLGATSTTIGPQTRHAMDISWLMSSFFSPFWGWAAIWCDLGLLGLGAYLYICSIIWRRCTHDVSRFLMLTVAVHGFIFTQMQEPGYMLYIAALIGIIWHQSKEI